jgi:hypothetical protein
MNDLIDYVLLHTERGACQCGKCIDAPPNPESHQPSGHTADLIFFKVCAKGNPDPEKLRQLIKAHRMAFGPCDLFDGQEHSYLQVGGWIGDQGLALQLMGLGSILGMWRLMTPRNMIPGISDDLAMLMAQNGLVSIQKFPSLKENDNAKLQH